MDSPARSPLVALSNSPSSLPRARPYVLPKGNWTKMLRQFPKSFTEANIAAYSVIAKSDATAQKHFNAGYRMFKAGKISNVLLSYEPENFDAFVAIKCRCQASFSLKKTYNLFVFLSDNGTVSNGSCTCCAGLGEVCKHVFALLWYLLDLVRSGDKFVPEDQSCTDKPCQWGTVKSATSATTIKFGDLQFLKHDPNKKLKSTSANIKRRSKRSKDFKNVLSSESLRTFRENCGTSLSMMSDILEENDFQPNSTPSPISTTSFPNTPDSLVPTTSASSINNHPDSLIPLAPQMPSKPLWNSVLVIMRSKWNDLLLKKCSITQQEAYELERLTRSQSSTQLWHDQRSIRITASQFGDIINRKLPVNEKFVERVFKAEKRYSSKFMQMGLTNENEVVQWYLESSTSSVRAYEVGLCVTPGLPFLGASPDRLVYFPSNNEFGLLEIKTLSKAKEENLTVQEAVEQNVGVASCLANKDGNLGLKRNHKFYFQVQGQLAITGIKWCDFIVNARDTFVERIYFEEGLFVTTMLPKLTSFYFTNYRPDST